ncbi:MAG: hypothetical protein LLG04_08635 [Parachlamydia sp.]|nr:hypothetical protein [Parachlamydia sp.]
MTRDRGYRRKQRDRVIKNRKKLVRDLDGEGCWKYEGKYGKHHPYDCGKTDCMLCHAHKKNKACASKWKDEHALQEIEIQKETHEELTNDMCDFGD